MPSSQRLLTNGYTGGVSRMRFSSVQKMAQDSGGQHHERRLDLDDQRCDGIDKILADEDDCEADAESGSVVFWVASPQSSLSLQHPNFGFRKQL